MNIRIPHPMWAANQAPTAPGSPPERRAQASPHPPAGDVRASSRQLAAQGFDPGEAGNLTAYLYGLTPVRGGWTIDEIERLLFVRHLVERHILKS